jgi:hypothetical protein
MMPRLCSQFVISSVTVCGFFATSLAFAEANPQQEKKKRLNATEMMKRAHEVRAKWKNFSGFKADVVVSAGSARVNGKVVVSAEGDVEFQLADSEMAEWATQDLTSLVSHRLPGGSQEYDVEFVRGERANALGRLIRFNDDRMHSVYRIRFNLITEVHRTMENQKLMINVVDVQWNKEKKILPRTYTVSWTDAKTGELSSMQVVNNRWVRVGEIDLPNRMLKVIYKEDGTRDVHEIHLTNHQLLSSE